MRITVAVLVALLVPLVASASAAPSSFQMDGGISFPPGATESAAPISLFAQPLGGLRALTLHAPVVTVEVRTLDSVTVRGPTGDAQVETDRSVATFALHDVTARLAGVPGSGWLGVHSERGSASWVASTPLEVHARLASTMGNPDGGAATEENSPVFVSSMDSPHLLWSSAGAWRYQGAGALRFEGLDLQVHAAENDTHVQTGHWETATTTGGSRQTWATLHFDEGSLELVDDASVSLATSAARVDWAGVAKRASTAAAPLELAHARTAVLLPLGDDAIDISLDSAPAATTGAEAVPFAAEKRSFVWPLLAAVALTAAGGAAWTLTRQRGRAAPQLAADECMELAEAAADGDNFVLAAHWAKRARESAPHVAQLWFDEGYYLLEAGDRTAAIDAFLEAARRDASGAPLYHAARALAQAGRTSEAAAHLARALRQRPHLRSDAELDIDLAPLLTRRA